MHSFFINIFSGSESHCYSFKSPYRYHDFSSCLKQSESEFNINFKMTEMAPNVNVFDNEFKHSSHQP